ncbi:MAG: caspase family protein [Armatimonadota bacterium]
MRKNIFILAALSLLFLCLVFVLPGCGGGSGGGGGGGGGGSSSDNTTTDDTASPAEPEVTVTPEPANKGALITVTMPDNSAVAVFAGVTDYPEGEYDLNYTANDAIDFKNALIGNELWNGASVSVQNNVQVTKSMIRNAVESAKNRINSDGLFIFMYSGHGTSSGTTGYIVPYDALIDLDNLISEDELKSWLGEFASNVKKYVVIDSCYSGEFIDKKADIKGSCVDIKAKFVKIPGFDGKYDNDKFAKSLSSVSNISVLTACSRDEISYEYGPVQNGLLIYAVDHALWPGSVIGPSDEEGDNVIYTNELGDYAKAFVPAMISSQNPQSYESCQMKIKSSCIPGYNKGTLITITNPDKTKCAVIVGVNDYPGEVNDLNYTVTDAADVKSSLLGAVFPLDSTVSVQNNVQVTKSMIETAITNAKNSIAGNGLFIFTYSGHGTSSGDTGYIIPYDALIDIDNLISEDELRILLDGFSSSVKKCVLLDSCYSGSFIDKSSGRKTRFVPIEGFNPGYRSEKFAKSIVGSSNTYVITASRGDETCWEFEFLENGLFTYYVYNGLGPGAFVGLADSNGDCYVTAEELYSYVSSKVTSAVANQHPQSYDNYSGSLTIK